LGNFIKNAEPQLHAFVEGHFSACGIPYDPDGMYLEDALLTINRWNSIDGPKFGITYWIDITE
jgi:hypothetical protein